MDGHGGPHNDRGAKCTRAPSCALLVRHGWLALQCLAPLILLLLLPAASTFAQSRRAASAPLELRLRIKWNQERPQAWSGFIELSEGQIVSLRHLGPSADGAASYRLMDGRVEVHELSPRTLSEIEIVVESTRAAQLLVRLDGAPEEDAHREVGIPLALLIAKPALLQPADGSPALTVSRAPGDTLRVKFENHRRIFTAGESILVDIEPHEVLAEDAGAALPLQLRARLGLVRSRTQEEVWYLARDIESDDAGNLPLIGGVEIPTPSEEGAYEFVIKLENRRFLAGGFTPVEHRQSLIVLADTKPYTPEISWREILAIDPTARSWWDSLRVLPQIKGIPGWSAPATPVASAKTTVVSREGRKWAALPAEAWQAIPLTTQMVGQPHIVQIELPRGGSPLPQILLLEQHANGAVVNVGLDAAGILPQTFLPDSPETSRHQLVYWPTSQTTWLVIAAPRNPASAESRFGAVKLFAGPQQLVAASLHARSDRGRTLALELPGRRWRELFGCDLKNPLNSAEATYEASLRLCGYLSAKGYNACRLRVAGEGKSLFPSDYFDSPQEVDAEIDAVELLLRVLTRQRLSLTPEFAFNAPLAELEVIRDQPDQLVLGADLMTGSGAAARQMSIAQGGVGAIYNPLDSLVQSAIRNPLEDFLDRYAHHESFGGLVIRLTPDCFTRFPHDDAGKDSPTQDRFAVAMQRGQIDAKAKPNQRASFSQPDKRDAWLSWRASQMADFYLSLQKLVMQARPEARLYFPLGDLLEGEAAQRRIRGTIFDRFPLRDLWLSAGIDPDSWEALGETVFLRPTPGPIDAASSANLESTIVNQQEWRQFEDTFWISGADSRTATLEVTLPGFCDRGPFRSPFSETWTAQPLSSDSSGNPLVDGLIAGDPFAFSLNGLGASEGADWIEIFRRLPPVMMKPVAPRSLQADVKSIPNTPVVLRQTVFAGRNWFYAVNPCPFPVTLTVDFQAPQGAKLESLGTKKLPPLQPIGKMLSWSYALAPREVVAGAVNTPKSVLTAYSTTVDRQKIVELSQELAALKSRLMQAKQEENRSYPFLANPDFEGEPGATPSGAFGWTVSGDTSAAAIVADRMPLTGSCLKLAGNGELVSLRSAPMPAPASQRLLFALDLRADVRDRSPDVKLVIEGEEPDCRTFIRRATISKSRALTNQWQRISFQIDYLPPLNNIRVGVDLCSSGSVYVDRAALSDFWGVERKAEQELKELAIATFALEQGRVTHAQRLLSGFWPNYFREQIDLPTSRQVEHTAIKPKDQTLPPKPDRSLQDRVKDMLPIPKSIQRR
jgi:hypothetical protein